jgi:NAD-dependent dihydropyrimidine dehydrogenase PreA subunit/bacterioferritin-associated ferredoxin
MKVVNVHSKVNMELCKGCKTCEMVCPTYAINVTKKNKAVNVDIEQSKCVGCWNCEQRCPEHAIEMIPCEPYRLEIDVSQVDYHLIEALCKEAHFHPKQVVCYCSGSRAEELAAAILSGAKSPDAVVMATGIGAGCGIECNQPILRFLEAAGISFERKKQSYQWYGRTMTVWEVPPEVQAEFPVFRFDEDRELFNRIINAPLKCENP